MQHRVLVPLDLSSTSEAVLSQLRRILRRHESEVVLMYARPILSLPGEENPEAYLRRLSFELTNEGFPSRYRLTSGPAAETILDAAAAEQATLIAMSTHGKTGMARWVLGSVTEKVLQASPLPVLVARSFPSGISRGRLESLPVRRFLVPLDGSPTSLLALRFVLSLASSVDAHVTLLHVDDPTPYEGRWNSPDETLKEADRLLREALIVTRAEHRQGDPGEEILKVIEDQQIDLVAMTTHGRSGPSRWIYGSVTSKVLRSAPVPMLVLRPPLPPVEPRNSPE